MFTVIFLILLAAVILLGLLVSPVILTVGLDILVVVGAVKLIINGFRKKRN